jgi:hypothetical protein
LEELAVAVDVEERLEQDDTGRVHQRPDADGGVRPAPLPGAARRRHAHADQHEQPGK